MTDECNHGRHDIDQPLTSESRSDFFVHDSCGFQVGDTSDEENEIDKVKAFLRFRSTTTKISERLHVIWLVLDPICIV